jgi:hypothetical protein
MNDIGFAITTGTPDRRPVAAWLRDLSRRKPEPILAASRSATM